MTPSDIEAAMQRAIAAVGRPCRSHVTDRNLIRPRPDGWWCIGTVGLLDGSKSWQVYWHPEKQKGWLWGIRHLEKGVQPRRFTGG